MLNSPPASVKICRLKSFISRSSSDDCDASDRTSTRTPVRSISARIGTSGSSRSRYTDSSPSVDQDRPDAFRQLQREVGALTGVIEHAVDRHLREGDRLDALAAHLVFGQRLVAELLERNRLERLARSVGVHQVAGEHRVEGLSGCWTSTPWRPSTIRSALMSWPIFSIAGSVSSGASSASASDVGIEKPPPKPSCPSGMYRAFAGVVDTAMPTSVARTGAVPSVITFRLKRPAAVISATSAFRSSVESMSA